MRCSVRLYDLDFFPVELEVVGGFAVAFVGGVGATDVGYLDHAVVAAGAPEGDADVLHTVAV